MSGVREIKLPYKLFKKGKVREIYDLGENLLLIVTDRISAFDWVLPEIIPHKGICLTQISAFWFDYFKDIIPNHMISADINKFPEEFKEYTDELYGRSMLVKKASLIPIECIVRGYISGSAWKSYQKDNTVCGMKLPSGMKESEQFNEPLFTPSTKAETGHDENISYEEMEKIIGEKDAAQLKELSLKIYKTASEYARKKGIIIADTKFEFGKIGDQIIIIDELLTPDSSRFWPADEYVPGKGQPSFDKQYVRDYLSTTDWDKNSAPPHLPDRVVSGTQKRYLEAYEKLTGKQLQVNPITKA
jgi:phosphoribosylaminoimidazole-succinocarboxamide synthase